MAGGFWRKVRSVLGLGAVGGVIGGVLGGAWALLSGFFAWGGIMFGTVWFASAFWGAFGAFSGGGFALLLAAFGAGRSLDELPIWKAGLWGAVAGAAFPFAFLLAIYGPGFPIYATTLLPVVGFCGGLGGLLGGGMLATAKRAERVELREADDFATLPPGV